MKDRLIELIEKANDTVLGFFIDGDIGILADYLVSNGVIVPPCKVGDTVYCIWQYSDFAKTEPPFIKPAKVESFVIDEGTIKVFPDNYSEMDDHWFRLLDIVFTQEEAEKALAERSEK